MTPEQWNTAIDMWNDGKSLKEIAAETQIPLHKLTGGNSLIGICCSIAREMTDKGWPDDSPIYIPDIYKKPAAQSTDSEEA